MKQSYDSDLEPHTIIHVTPATPLATDSSKTNVLDTLLDELQTFSKPSSQQSSTPTIGGQSTRKLIQSMASVDSAMSKKGDWIIWLIDLITIIALKIIALLIMRIPN